MEVTHALTNLLSVKNLIFLGYRRVVDDIGLAVDHSIGKISFKMCHDRYESNQSKDTSFYLQYVPK